jgi:hypothetical protein
MITNYLLIIIILFTVSSLSIYIYSIIQLNTNTNYELYTNTVNNNITTNYSYPKKNSKTVSFNLNPEIIYYNESGYLHLERNRY